MKQGAQCASGVCVGPVKQCAAPTECKEVVGECNPDTGFCTFVHKPDGTPCNDGNAANGYADKCKDGFCKPCEGFCCGKPDGLACNTGNKCIKNAKCENDACVGTLKICNPPNQCKVVIGECNPTTGFCTFEKKPNWTQCNDGKATTIYDYCVDGFCVGYYEDPMGTPGR
jgi:hypothetical protein